MFGAVSSKKRYLPTAPFSTINLCGKMYLITEDGEVEKELAVGKNRSKKWLAERIGKMSKIKIAAVQMPTVSNKMENVRKVREYLEKLKDQNLDFVVLPEMFCCPYKTENFPAYAEEEGGEVWKQLSEYAKHYGIYLVGGSIPEKDAKGRVYNTHLCV